MKILHCYWYLKSWKDKIKWMMVQNAPPNGTKCPPLQKWKISIFHIFSRLFDVVGVVCAEGRRKVDIFGKKMGVPLTFESKIGVTPNFHPFFASAGARAAEARHGRGNASASRRKKWMEVRGFPNFWLESYGVPPFFNENNRLFGVKNEKKHVGIKAKKWGQKKY